MKSYITKKYTFDRLGNTFFKLTTIIALCLLLVAGGCSSNAASVSNNITETVTETVPATDAEPATEATTKAPDPVTIDIMMIGDVLMHTPALQSGLQADGTYNYDHFFTNIKSDIAAADISIVNQETILGGTAMGLSSYPCFNSPFELGTSEVNAGFNVVLHATNHAMDKGTQGIDNCLNFWKTTHPSTAVLGINTNEEDYKNNIYVYEKEGFKVAILNYTYGTNGINPPANKYYYVNLLDKEKITADVTRAKQMADMVVVCPHWGTEYVYKPANSVIEWTNLFLELGVDVVIGTHPHVIEPVETLTRADGHRMVVYYSLGNFVSNQDQKPRMIGGMAKLQLVKDSDGTSYVDNYQMVPVITHKVSGRGGLTAYKITDYTEALASKNAIRNNTGCADFSFKYCQDLCAEVLGDTYDKEKQAVIVKLGKK